MEWLIAPFFFVTMLMYSSSLHENHHSGNIIDADTEGYYMYLPSVFIYDGFTGYRLKSCCRRKKDSGEWISKYTYGVALMQSPFFLGAHTLAKWNYNPEGLSGDALEKHDEAWKASGFSWVYAKGILLAGAFYASFGLLLLYLTLKRLVTKWPALFTIFALFFGTNLLYYSAGEAGMSHSYSFFLFALALYLLPNFLNKPNIKNALLLGIPLGMIVLIRPTNIIFLSVLFLWEVYNVQDLKDRFKFFFQQIPSSIFIFVPLVIVVIPQMMYWNHMTDHWIFYSYRDQGFKYWNSPYIFSVLFSHQNGFFAYAPMMLLIFPGLFLSFRSKRNSPILATALFVLCTYIFASWWAWWFGGAYGARSFIEYFAVLSLPLAMLVCKVMETRKIWLNVAMLALMVFLWIGSIKTILQYKPPWDGEKWTTERYWKVMEKAYLF